jgi:hypothetical protein
MIQYRNPMHAYVVNSWPGQGTGETVYQDQNGNAYRTVSESEAQQINNTTTGYTVRIYNDGSIR